MAARSSPSRPTSARARNWRRRARRRCCSASSSGNIFIEDLREEFVRDYVFPMFRANALYEGQYLLGTSIARPLIAKKADRDRPQGRRRRGVSRRDRQGQRPGAVRADLLRARSVDQDRRAVARVELQGPRGPAGVRARAPDPGRQGQGGRGAVLGRRQPVALVVRGQGAGGPGQGSAAESSISAPSRRWKRPTRRPRCASASTKGDAVSLDGKKLSPAALLTRAQRARQGERHRPHRSGREPLRRHEVARRLRDARRHDPAGGASRHRSRSRSTAARRISRTS